MVYWRGAQPPISVLWPQFWHLHLPTVAIRLNGNHHIGRPVADILHFNLDRGFKFGSCFARLFHGDLSPRYGPIAGSEIPRSNEDGARPSNLNTFLTALFGAQDRRHCRRSLRVHDPNLQTLHLSQLVQPSMRRADFSGHEDRKQSMGTSLALGSVQGVVRYFCWNGVLSETFS